MTYTQGRAFGKDYLPSRNARSFSCWAAVPITGLCSPGPSSDYPLVGCTAARGALTEVGGKTRAITDSPGFYPVLLQPVERSSSPRQPGILVLMSFSRALFVAWCAWIGSLVVGSIVLILLDKPEWRVAVGMLSLLIGFLSFIFSRRI